MKKLAAELFGTFSLVFAGTGAIIINDASWGTITHIGVALTFGLIVLAMIYAVGDVSGCHLNPAVTIGFFLARRVQVRHVVPYVACQCVGAGLASLTWRAMFPTHPTLGATFPAGSAVQSFVLETILTMILMFVILSVSSGSKEKGVLVGVAVGAVIALEALFAGAGQRGIDEPGPLARPRRRRRAAGTLVGVPHSPHPRSLLQRLRLPLHSRAGVLLPELCCSDRLRSCEEVNHEPRCVRRRDEGQPRCCPAPDAAGRFVRPGPLPRHRSRACPEGLHRLRRNDSFDNRLCCRCGWPTTSSTGSTPPSSPGSSRAEPRCSR